MTLKLRHLPILAALSLLPGGAWAVPDVPLPEKTSEFDPENSFPLLPPVEGGVPPPEEQGAHLMLEEDVILPPPTAQPEDLPDYTPLGAPSDGEAMPALPYAPGLVVPKFNRNSVPAIPGLTDKPGDVPGDGLLPVPELKADTSRGFWFPSPREARQVSIKEKKPLLLFFAQRFDARLEDGTTGCPTIALNDDLFAWPGDDVQQQFNQLAGSKLVLTALSYPTRGLKLSNLPNSKPDPKTEALLQFQKYFKVTGFPCIILIDENGKELERSTGYNRVRDNNKQLYSTAHRLLDRLKEAVRRDDERKQAKQERIDRLTAQGYRTWYNRNGYSILGKLVEATPQRVVLMDEKNAMRYIHPNFLRLYDAEWARRKQAGLLTSGSPESSTASTNP